MAAATCKALRGRRFPSSAGIHRCPGSQQIFRYRTKPSILTAMGSAPQQPDWSQFWEGFGREDWHDQRHSPLTWKCLGTASRRTCGSKAYFGNKTILIISRNKLKFANLQGFIQMIFCGQMPSLATGILASGRIPLWRDHWKEVFSSLF